MKDRVILKNLQVSDFIHVRELELQKTAMNSPEIKKLIEMASDVNLKLNKTRIQGTYIRLYPETAPELFTVLRDVCRILDYDGLPEIYLCREMSIIVQPCAEETEYIVISDYVLEYYDEDMLYFALGNAIAMILAGHVKMTTAAAYMGCNIWTALPQMKFKEYLHATDATSDRGGLLACQSLAAAARCHLFELGLPPSVSRRLFSTDEEAEEYLARYLYAVEEKNGSSRSLANLGEWWQNVNAFEGAGNAMLYDLYCWYCSDYHRVLDKYREVQS